jgi:hypothetical protein
VNFDQNDINQAAAIAAQKLAHINIHSPAGRPRPPQVIRSRIIGGKLADAAVKEWLQQRITMRASGHNLYEYDLIRDDNFVNPDEFDLCLAKDGEEPTDIEVRSSFCYRLAPVDNMLNKFSIYGWYTTRTKANEHHHDWYWQFVYYLRPRDISRQHGWPQIPVFDDHVDAGSVTGYIVGGASKAMLEDKTRSSIRGDQDGAFYESISPICAGEDAADLAALMIP